MAEKEDRRRYSRCSFCGKGQDQVGKLIAGPGVIICDQCIELCQDALDNDRGSTSAGLKRGDPCSVTARDHGRAAADTQGTDPYPLTKRELQLAILFAHGMSVKDIVVINSKMVEFRVEQACRR